VNKQRIAGLLSLATLCLLSAAPGRAALVTFQASGVIDQADNTSLFTGALSTAAVGQTLSLDFTVDTQTPGISFGPGSAGYLSSLVSADASIGSGKFGLSVDSNAIGIVSNSFDGANYNTAYSLNGTGNVPATFTGTATEFDLFTVASG
jgi:hypothetical protein